MQTPIPGFEAGLTLRLNHVLWRETLFMLKRKAMIWSDNAYDRLCGGFLPKLVYFPSIELDAFALAALIDVAKLDMTD